MTIFFFLFTYNGPDIPWKTLAVKYSRDKGLIQNNVKIKGAAKFKCKIIFKILLSL